MIKSVLVSCLMVTRPSRRRLPFLARSIAAYTKQTHARRELVVVVDPRADEPAAEVIGLVQGLGRDDVTVVAPDEIESLGALRNASMDAARGEVLCQWDDDDFHHPDRVAAQLRAMDEAGRGACYLEDVWQLLVEPRQLYWTSWRKAPGGGHPGTAMFRTGLGIRYVARGHEATYGEDTAFLRDLDRAGHVHGLAGRPDLLIYVSHGSNLWPPEHHRMLVDRLAISAALVGRREAAIRASLAGFDFGPEPVAVVGSNGPAFTLAGKPGPP